MKTVSSDSDKNDDMPDEIDFAQGVRGKFYRPDACVRMPFDRGVDPQAPAPSSDAAAINPVCTDGPAAGMWSDRDDTAVVDE